jgi:siderophore synthetase component
MTLIEDEDEMRGKVFHAVFQGQLGELILTLSNFYGVDESLFWQRIAQVAHQVYAELKQDPAIAEQASIDEASLFEEKLALKALTRMRLGLPCANRQYTFEKSVNPMQNPS